MSDRLLSDGAFDALAVGDRVVMYTRNDRSGFGTYAIGLVVERTPKTVSVRQERYDRARPVTVRRGSKGGAARLYELTPEFEAQEARVIRVDRLRAMFGRADSSLQGRHPRDPIPDGVFALLVQAADAWDAVDAAVDATATQK